MINNKTHVLVISPFVSPNLGGVETHIDKLVNYATKNNYFLTVLTYQPLTNNKEGRKHEKHENYEIIRIKWIGKGWFPKLEKYFPLVFLYLFPGLFYLSLKYYKINNETVDCIHAHGLASAAIAKILNILKKNRIVVSTHAVYNFSKRPLLKFIIYRLLKDFNKILAVSEVSKSELIEMGISKEKVDVHPNWIETEIFKPNNIEIAKSKSNKTMALTSTNNQSDSLPDFKLKILFVGRFLPQKGISLILESAKELPTIQFHFVGSGPLEYEVMEAELKLNNVIYHGVLMQNDKDQQKKLIEIYNSCDYLLSPYLYDEGFSATLIEAVATGTPVIITDRGSPPQFLSKDVSILLSNNPTKEELVKVLGLLDIPSAEFKNKCREFALQNFSEKNASIIINSYNN